MFIVHRRTFFCCYGHVFIAYIMFSKNNKIPDSAFYNIKGDNKIQLKWKENIGWTICVG